MYSRREEADEGAEHSLRELDREFLGAVERRGHRPSEVGQPVREVEGDVVWCDPLRTDNFLKGGEQRPGGGFRLVGIALVYSSR